jgi:hypothetical protein
MIEFWFLLFFLLLLYVAECAVWVPAGSVAFRLPFNPKRPIQMITKLRPVRRSGITFAYPFSLRSEVMICSPLPLLLSPGGIVADPGVVAGLTRGEFVPFDEMLRIEPELRTLLVNGKAFVTTASEVEATELAELLKRVRKRKLKDRASEIEKVLDHTLDPDGAYSRLKEYTDRTSDLRLDLLGLLLVIFVISPILVLRWGLVAMWPFLLAYLVLNVSLIAWDFRRANRELFPMTGLTRWSSITMIMLSPPAALHATKYLARDIGYGYHPLAFAASRCSNREFRELASWVLRDVMFVPDTDESLDRRSADCVQWFRSRFQNAVLALVHKHGINPNELIAPPSRESERVQSYCPRCLSQFVISDGACTDCDRIPLLPFDAPS